MAKGIQDQRYAKLIERLVTQRKDASLSQAQVAERLGKLQQFVSKYESGERRLDVVEFLDIAAALGLEGVMLLQEVGRR